MKLVIISYFKDAGGVGTFVSNLKQFFQDAEVSYFQNTFRERLNRKFDKFLSRLLVRPIDVNWSVNLISITTQSTAKNKDFDVHHINWVGAGFMSLKNIFGVCGDRKLRIITLHDLWAITGGCHVPFSETCITDCKRCPCARNFITRFMIGKVSDYKLKSVQNKNVTPVAPSSFVASLVQRKTGILPIVIPNPVDVRFTKKTDRVVNPKQLSFYVSGYNFMSDRNKGGGVLIDFVNSLAANTSEVILNFTGTNPPRFKSTNVSCIDHGVVSAKRRNQLMMQADVTLVTSTFETFSYVAAESVQNGTPVFLFGKHGATDFIFHRKNGYYINCKQDYLEAIDWYLREFVDCEYNHSLSMHHVSERYEHLYGGHIGDHTSV